MLNCLNTSRSLLFNIPHYPIVRNQNGSSKVFPTILRGKKWEDLQFSLHS